DGSGLNNAIDGILNDPSLNVVGDAIGQLADYSGSMAQDGFQFPILENPASILVGTLMGRPETLFSYSTGRNHFELAASVGVGIPDLFGCFLSAGITFDADLNMGYDTAGLITFARDPNHDPADLLHGFYFDNGFETGGDSTYFDPITNTGGHPIRKTGLYMHG